VRQKNEGARLSHVSLAVGQIYEMDVDPLIKARMLRELAAWYRTWAARADNPVIWDARLLTSADLDGEASRIEQATGVGRPTL